MYCHNEIEFRLINGSGPSQHYRQEDTSRFDRKLDRTTRYSHQIRVGREKTGFSTRQTELYPTRSYTWGDCHDTNKI